MMLSTGVPGSSPSLPLLSITGAPSSGLVGGSGTGPSSRISSADLPGGLAVVPL